MKKTILTSLISILAAGSAGAGTSWWLQPTICQTNSTKCYTNMGTGFENEMWDATGNCWGVKMICAAATSNTTDSEPVAISKSGIANGTLINDDFDTSVLNGDCFGVRKTTSNGSMVSVNGNYVRVWCNNILDNADETLTNGEITFGTQPTCADLSENGWVGVLNQKCYGKYFNQSNYFINCESGNLLPTKLIITNGADIVTGDGSTTVGYPTTQSSANNLFNIMKSVSSAQKLKYF